MKKIVLTVDGECAWTEQEEGAYWSTECKHKFTFYDGSPKGNEFKHCPFCGGKIKEVGK